jgi:hypothetical protein
MMNALVVIIIAIAISSIAIYYTVYRLYRSPFFLCMLFSVTSLACAAALSLGQWTRAAALIDIMLTLAGASMIAASGLLALAFRLAGEKDAQAPD